jgi:hypothetical protein
VTKWRRVGIPFELTRISDGDGVDVGWSWRLEAEAAGHRQIRVIVAAGSASAPGAQDESDQELRARGERAIDTFLAEDEPPALIVVSSGGIRRVDG